MGASRFTHTFAVALMLFSAITLSLRGDGPVRSEPIRESANGITVLGEVTRPSVVSYGTGLTLLDCLVECGGVTGRVLPSEVMVIRNGRVVRVNTRGINGIIVDGQKRQNGSFKMARGDIVVVPAKPNGKTEN